MLDPVALSISATKGAASRELAWSAVNVASNARIGSLRALRLGIDGLQRHERPRGHNDALVHEMDPVFTRSATMAGGICIYLSWTEEVSSSFKHIKRGGHGGTIAAPI